MGTENLWGLNSLQRLKSLCHMLRNNADRILSGEMGVTITNRTLYELNEAVDNLQDGLSPPHLSPASQVRGQDGGRGSELEEWNYHLQLVLDIVSMAPVLVLYKGKENGTSPVVHPVSSESSPHMAQPVRLGYFTSLSHLEISYLPIKTIQDLLKMRERLETLVVVNCYSNNFRLQDVLEMCDQEVSVPMQWSTLKTLCLRCNKLVELDGSLRLCPRLETLDMSRNRLVTTEAYLGYLMELRYVDLSYNDLTLMPAFSATAKKKLRVLLLAGNRLIDLSGVEEMTSLEELDVSENLISSHHALLPVRALHRLDKLNTRDCPASIRKDHRLLALQYVSTVSLSRKFSLDGQLVTHKEIQNSRAILNNLEHHFSRRHHNIQIPDTPRRVIDYADGTSHMTRGQDGGATASDDLAISVTSVRKKKGRKKAKARMTDIADMDTSTGGELSSKEVTPSTTPKTPSRMEALAQLRRLELQEKRAEMEHLRRCYGDNWLQAVEDQAVIPRPASIANTMNLTGEGTVEKSGSLKKSASAVENDTTDGRKNLTASVDVHTADRSEVGDGVSQSESPEKVRSRGEKREHSPSRPFDKDSMFLSSGSGAEDGGANESSSRDSTKLQQNGDMDLSRRTEVTLLSDDGVTMGKGDSGSREEGEQTLPYREKEASSLMTDSTHDTLVEPEDQSDPFIVTLPGQPEEHLLVTVSPRYLVEKDINGVIQDKLDLQSLESVNVEVEEVKDRSGVNDPDEYHDLDIKEVKISLDFSYVRKDRRCRVYVMEDFLTAQHFSELVQPFLDAKVEAAMKKLQVQYQCLKCSSEFTRRDAHTTVRTAHIPHTGSSKDFSSLADIGSEKVVLQCPKCMSDHVVQLETPPESTYSASASSSPPKDMLPNSLSRGQSFDQMMSSQPPKAHSTPLKRQSSSSDMQTAASPRKGSKPSSFRSLFNSDSHDLKQKGDGPTHDFMSAIKSSEGPKQEGDTVAGGRHRSNAFYNDPSSVDSRQRSNAVSSQADFTERSERSSGSALSYGSERDRTRSSASNSVTSSDITHHSQLATFGALNNLHLALSSSNSSDTTGRGVVSSVDSDITILHKRESTASVVVLSDPPSANDVTHFNSVSVNEDEQDKAPAFEEENEESAGNSLDVPAMESRKLTPVPQEGDSLEATPMGSPLSSSICSSMVSSVYYNSLQPNTSTSSVYVTASDHSVTANDSASRTHVKEEETDNEVSIYDQGEATVRRRSTHKESISSEVEVLSLEEEHTEEEEPQLYNTEQDDEVLPTPTASEGEATTTPTPTADVGPNVVRVAGEDDDSFTVEAEGQDFSRLDHRLALYLMMTVFENDEEFKFKVKCCVCQYMMLDEYEALVVVTTLRLYILRINTEDTSVELSEALTLMEAQPHAELKRVEIGLGKQTLRLEYSSDCSSYTLVLRDTEKLQVVKEMLSDHLQSYAMETGVPSSAVFNEDVDQATLDNLTSDVLTRSGQTDLLRLYVLGYIARGHNSHHPMAFVVSTSEICLVKTNHQWPSPSLQAPVTVETVGKQFTVLERQKINNIATVEVHEEDQRKLRITFFNETSGDEIQWLVTMETDKGVISMVDAVRGPWEEAFGVEMDVEFASFDVSL